MNRTYTGKDLAKVLIYYGLIEEVQSTDFNIICPFHDDINPSMKISLDDGSFFCFGCEIKGDAFDFVKYANPKLNDLQCCILLEQIVKSKEVRGINIRIKKKRKKQNKQAIDEAYTYYYGLPTTDWNNVRTEEERKVLDYMSARGFTRKALNIGKCKASYSMSYPVLFPILDNGEFKGYVGRTTNKRIEQKRKYLYNEGFRKRDTLCGTYSKKSIVYICEGYMDYLSLKTRGHLKNVVALLGWHISDEQTKKLKEKGVETVVSVLDNDKCGIKGTEYLKRFFNVVRFQYPEGVKDCGEMNEEQIKKCLQNTWRMDKNGINS